MNRIFQLSKITTLCSLIIVATSCNTSSKKTNSTISSTLEESSEPQKENFEQLFDSTTSGIPIFYNMYLTVEMASLFKNINAAFNEATLNPTDNIINYETSYQKSANLGVYAVDLSYTKVFEQYEKSSAYFTAMHNLSAELGIPDDYFYDAAVRFDKNLSNKDSLGKIANEVYMTTENYLNKNDQKNNASLIVMGGWIEALYLACDIYLNYDQDAEILDRIVEQKYSLEEIIKLLEPYDKDDIIADYIEKLKGLRTPFKKIKEDYDNPGVADENLEILANKITEIRTGIVKI